MSSHNKPVVPWAEIPLKEDILYERLCHLKEHPQPGLSKSSVTAYIGCLRRIRKQFGEAPTISVICMAEVAIAQLETNAATHGISSNTLKADINAMLAVAKHVMSVRQQEHTTGYMKVWQAAHKRIQDVATRAFASNKATLNQRAGFTPYSELCTVRDALPYTSMLRLWLAMCTMIPCARAGDYAHCKLFLKEPTAEELLEHTDNYCVLAPGNQYVKLRVFKTSKCYPMGITMAIPQELSMEIENSLRASPSERAYLFVQAGGDNEPYLVRKSFTNRLDEELKYALRNLAATAQLVRRAYITAAHAQLREALQSEDHGTAAVAREKMTLLAHCCGHLVTTQQKYVFDLDDAGRPELLEVGTVGPVSPMVACKPIVCEIDGMQ